MTWFARLLTESSRRGWRPLLCVCALFLVLCGTRLNAQGKSHVYVSLGAGATDLDSGLQVVIPGGRVGFGAEVGLGWSFFGAITGSYHFVTPQPNKADLFATAGYASVGSSEFSSRGGIIGVGAVYWPSAYLGLRLDGFGFGPVWTQNNIPGSQRSPSRYWGVRAGLAFRFR